MRRVNRVTEYEARRGAQREAELLCEERLQNVVESGRAKPLHDVIKRKLHEVRLSLSRE